MDEFNRKLPELYQLERESGEILKTGGWAEWDKKSIKFNEKISQSEELDKAIDDVTKHLGVFVNAINILTKNYDVENEKFKKGDLKRKMESLRKKKDELQDKCKNLMKRRVRILVEAGRKLVVEIRNGPIKSEYSELKDKICEIKRILSEASRPKSEIYDESF